MIGINSAVTGKFSDPPVIMTGITSRFISRPGHNITIFKALLRLEYMPSLIYIRFTEGANSLTVNKRNSRIGESSTLVDIAYSVYYVDAKNTDNKVNNLVRSQNMSDVWNLHVQYS